MGTHGIHASDFTALHIENCIINRFSNDGILVDPSPAGTKKLFIKDSISRNNSGGAGINLTGTALITTIEGTRVENNDYGILNSGSGSIVTARGCLSSGNTFTGFESDDGVLNIESSVSSNNGGEGVADFGGTVRVSNSTVADNGGAGFFNSLGTFESRGNNTVRGNNGGGAQTFGTITPLTAL